MLIETLRRGRSLTRCARTLVLVAAGVARIGAFLLDDGLQGRGASTQCVKTAQSALHLLRYCGPCAPNFVMVIDTWVRLSGVRGHTIATAPGGGSSPHPGVGVACCNSLLIYHHLPLFYHFLI